jgi:MOSC domain-containing protein YiiM
LAEVRSVLSVNTGEGRVLRPGGRPSGIDKRPTAGAVEVRAPGARGSGLGSGLVGDDVCDSRHHGGDDQAVYAYAREDLDRWAEVLGRSLANGVFGENLTTTGVDVTGAVIGDTWRIGDGVVLEVTKPRIPCGVFRTWMGEKGWVRRFSEHGAPGAYLRVLAPGVVRAGDPVTVEHRPDRNLTVGVVFRAMTVEPSLLDDLLERDELPDEARDLAGSAQTLDLDQS